MTGFRKDNANVVSVFNSDFRRFTVAFVTPPHLDWNAAKMTVSGKKSKLVIYNAITFHTEHFNKSFSLLQHFSSWLSKSAPANYFLG